MASSKSLRHGVTDQLVAAATAGGLKLSDREIRRRLQCARTYATEAQIGRAVADFGSWRDLSEANFPTYDAEPDEPPADHRTDAERDRDKGRALLDAVGEQGALFPLDQFEPVTATLKDLQAYTGQMEELTERFRARDRKRRAYVDRLIEVADGDLSMLWLDAAKRLPSEETEE